MPQTPQAKSEGITLTPELINEFLDFYREKGRKEETISAYSKSLFALQTFLQGSKLSRSSLEAWKQHLLKENYSNNSINKNLNAVNRLLSHARRGDLKVDMLPSDTSTTPELTRNEYLRLLQTARLMGKQRVYLLVKLFGSMDIALQDLPNITAKAIQDGVILLHNGSSTKVLPIPKALQEELLSYMQEQVILDGPVFLTRTGLPLNRGHISTDLQSLAQEARVPLEKANPRAIRKMYHSTMAEIQRSVGIIVEQTFRQMLDKEQNMIGWDKK